MKIKRITIQADVSDVNCCELVGFNKEDIIATETGHGEFSDWITIWYIEKMKGGKDGN